MDKRNEKSKEAIKKALIRLSKEKAYSEITVCELCKAAGVSRSTFYNNYHLFNDVAAEISYESMEKIRKEPLTRTFFDLITENGDELKLLLEAGIFGQQFGTFLKEILAEELRQNPGNDQNELTLNVMALYHAYGLFGVLLNLVRLKNNPQYDPIYRESVETLMELHRKLLWQQTEPEDKH